LSPGRPSLALLALALSACGTPPGRPCLIEAERAMPLSTLPLATRHVYRNDAVEIALSAQTFEETKAAVCERRDFQEACASLVSLDGNPPVPAPLARQRERVVEYVVAGALDLGRATVKDRESGEFFAEIVVETYEDTCGAHHRIGRRYALPGTTPFLEVRDL
jgi:hypothetical protein